MAKWMRGSLNPSRTLTFSTSSSDIGPFLVSTWSFLKTFRRMIGSVEMSRIEATG